MEGLVFGLVDNGILLLSIYTGIGIERWFKRDNSSFIGGIMGAGIGNTFSDTVGAVLDPYLVNSVTGITIGCLIPLFLIPLIEYFRRKYGTVESNR